MRWACIFLLFPSLAFGQQPTYAYQFATSGGMPSSTFTVDVGQSVQVSVYIVETSQTVTLHNVGLATAGVQVSINDFASISVMAGNPQFEAVFPPPAPFTLAEGTFSLAGVQSSADDPLRILVGTFTFMGQTQGTATIQAGTLAGFNMIVRNDGAILDGRIVSGSASVQVVPECGGHFIAYCVVALGTLALRRAMKSLE